jgi:hypothetical protein
MRKINRDSIINRIRQAIAGIQKDFSGAATIVLDGVPTKPADATATLSAAVTKIDEAIAAETAFHQAVAEQDAAIATALALLANLKTLVVNQFGKKGAQLADFGMATATPKPQSEATKAAAVLKREATRLARGTKGPKAKLAIRGIVPTPPATPVKPA